jgi:hypothetical protein
MVDFLLRTSPALPVCVPFTNCTLPWTGLVNSDSFYKSVTHIMRTNDGSQIDGDFSLWMIRDVTAWASRRCRASRAHVVNQWWSIDSATGQVVIVVSHGDRWSTTYTRWCTGVQWDSARLAQRYCVPADHEWISISCGLPCTVWTTLHWQLNYPPKSQITIGCLTKKNMAFALQHEKGVNKFIKIVHIYPLRLLSIEITDRFRLIFCYQ